MKQAIYKLKGKLQNYVWGGKNYIPDLLQIEKEENQYYAEWWLGTHRLAPSIINVDGQEKSLLTFLSENPTALSQENNQPELPYLLKILDVAKPLSIQLHPTKKQAKIGFDLENQKGINLDAPTRTYKDQNHKPEMMIALSDFWLLHGFKNKESIIETLNTRPSLTTLAEKLKKVNLADFYAEIMQANQQQLSQWILPIIKANQDLYQKNKLGLENPDYWLLYTIEAMDIAMDKLDAGLICFYLFNIVHLKKGEGIYQDAGIPHAYLRGQNIELMATSDNVIRGGLTPKHIDIPELLKIINCEEITPQIIPSAPDEGIFTYTTPATDFALTNINYTQNELYELNAKDAEILLVMQGKINIKTENTSFTLQQGESVFISANTNYQISSIEMGYAVIAKLP
ncbi:mannose-6-phosphate isomerase type 1 [Bisgaardia hudsonensis]|uniref:mannose-6-phosphate isomerase n=1 Tax=Bisgaardia hudsonensis TaxID=109472 RepID=A0A4R2N2R3_9PAST|nr:mannose-6-phosphate isomerase, class I [Bisgaardia hudsonensis]QLB12609.1 mannose-6-phosphate isomerase, class I [Bisgaardia hudsonensis]TCP14151.1 mannose-6-phosphate isomerase type 1 [Bisgaardia hudsonensis]